MGHSPKMINLQDAICQGTRSNGDNRMIITMEDGRKKRPPPRGPRHRLLRDTDGVEGFIGEIPALAIITFAVTAFMISAISATGSYLDEKERSEDLDLAKDISQAIGASPDVLVDGRMDHLSAKALDQLATGGMTLDLRNTGDMRVTVIDLQASGGGGLNGTGPEWTFGNTDRTDAPTVTYSRTVLIGHEVAGDQVMFHIGRMEVRTW
jgi:hypothetical protein